MATRPVKITVLIAKEDSNYIFYSPALDLSSSGKTIPEVKRRFAQAVKAFFEELEEMGTLDEALMQLGWKKREFPISGWIPETANCGRSNVPTHLLRKKQMEIRVPVEA